MNRRFPSDVSDIWEVFLRRRWWFIVTPLIVIAVALPVIFKWPKTWQSDTSIQVEPQQVPPTYVASTVTTDASARLTMVEQEVLSRTNLQRIIGQFGLYRQEQGKSEEDIVELMRKDISIKPVDPHQGLHPERPNSLAFTISYEGSDRALVQEVTRQLGTLFIERNLSIRQKQAAGTTEFLDDQVQKASEDVDTKGKKLREFEAQHIGTLPDQQGAIFAIMGQLQSTLAANSDAIARDEDRKTYDQSIIAFLSKNTPVDAAGNPLPAAPVQNLIQTQLDARKAELLDAQQKYTSRHPDVVRLKEEVAALTKLAKQPPPEPTATAKGTAASQAVFQSDYTANQLHTEMLQLDREIKRRTVQQGSLEAKLKSTEARLEGLPATAAEFSDLSRDYQESQRNYEHLMEEKHASDMSKAMENEAKGEILTLLDPASLPDKPIKPDLLLCSLFACVGGIAAGILLGLSAELRDKRINNDRDVAYYLPVPLLASLPMINRGEEKRRVLQLKGQTQVITVEPSEPSGADIPGPVPSRITVDPSASGLSRLAARDDRSQTPLPDLGVGSSRPQPEGLKELWYRGGSGDNAFAMEQLKIVRTRLRELMRVRTMRTLMVTSSVQGEGKTMVAANLAFSMSQLEGLKVLLVDADLRKANLAPFLNMKPQLGLSTYLMNGKGLTDVRLQLNENLAVVPTLTLEENATELLTGRRMRDFLHEALRDYDLIIVDAPPVVPIADAQVLTSMVDGALLVVRAGTCPFDLACSAVELLQPKIVGVILNGVARLPNSSYYYGYYGKSRGNLQWSKS